MALTPKKAYGKGGLVDLLSATQDALPSAVPDVVTLDLRDVPQLARDNRLQPFDPRFAPATLNDLFPFARGAGQVEGKNDRIGRRPLELLQQRGRGVRLDGAVAALNKHRLERPGEPLLGITDEHHRGTTGCGWTAWHRNGTLGTDRPATQPPVKRATRRTRRACWLQ